MKSEIISKLEAHIESECTPIDREKRFDDFLNECYSFEQIGGPFACMSPSSVLKEVDPIAYRCGVNDYEDGEGWVEVGGTSYESNEVEKAKEGFIEDLESGLSDLETELEDLQTDEDASLKDKADLSQRIAGLKADIEAVNQHTF